MKSRWKGRFAKKSDLSRRQTLSGIAQIAQQSENSVDSRVAEDANSDSDTSTDHFGGHSVRSGTGNTNGWNEGRRIVDLWHLAGQLVCKLCGTTLSLKGIQREQRYGYASMLYITCVCGLVNTVTTGRSHRDKQKAKKGTPVFDINTKAVLGMLHAGVNHRQMNALMAAMEIQGLHHSSMIKREEELHHHIQDVANESCITALQEEANESNVDPVQNGTNETQPMATEAECATMKDGIFKYDMGWQKRGSGRGYDSKSGVGTLIGNKTGKICSFGVRLSDCRVCSTASRSNSENVPPHQCKKNWSGSAKGMEPDVGVELIKDIEEKGVTVRTLIMDDDTTTMARIRGKIEHRITKWSDVNHTAKHLTNSLYSLQKKHKCLTRDVISYLKKCFNYALAQTKGVPTQCKLQIEQIVPHAFGDHINCGHWCGFQSDPESYHHRTLNKDLTGGQLQQELEAVFQVFSNNADKRAPGGSTRDVESFNNMVASKAPKRCHFSGSGNLLSRVGCAVAQKNLGNNYVSVINEKLGLSPGSVCKKEGMRRDAERRRQLKFTNTRTHKLKRLQKKLSRWLDTKSIEKKEGTTYKNAVAMSHHADVTTIPTVSQQPILETVDEIRNLVVCDIETGSLARDADILQIAGCYKDSVFEQYVTPSKSVSPAASKLTGLTAQGGVLFHNGAPVKSMPLRNALEMFLAWLEVHSPVVLVGHNFKIFDFPRLLRAFKITGLQKHLETICVGGIDTLPMYKFLHPDMDKFSQEHLYTNLVGGSYSAHNALDDVISLQKLLNSSQPDENTLKQFSLSTKWGFQMLNYNEEGVKNSSTLTELVNSKTISSATAKKSDSPD